MGAVDTALKHGSAFKEVTLEIHSSEYILHTLLPTGPKSKEPGSESRETVVKGEKVVMTEGCKEETSSMAHCTSASIPGALLIEPDHACKDSKGNAAVIEYYILTLPSEKHGDMNSSINHATATNDFLCEHHKRHETVHDCYCHDGKNRMHANSLAEETKETVTVLPKDSIWTHPLSDAI